MAAPRRPRLGPDEAHVWGLVLDVPAAVVAQLAALLSAAERARAERFHDARLRERFVVAHGRLRQVLACYLECPPAALDLEAADGSKPVVPGSGLEMSLSHAQGCGLVAVARRAVGVDLEPLRPDLAVAELAPQVFSPRELAALASFAATEQVAAFLRGWTRKEAYLKARGVGFHFPPRDCEVALGPGVERALLAVAGEPGEEERFRFRDLEPWPGFVGALAVAAPLAGLGLFLFDEPRLEDDDTTP